ncbi:MAG: Holliday junction branch migration protein RuvA [Patescibacteria group bacterium]
MISYLNGKVKYISEKSLTLLVGGVGYEVFALGRTISGLSKDQELELSTVHVIKENAQELYGFETEREKSVFNLLLTISGVGPKSALNILDSASPEEITEAVIHQDPVILEKVSGIGKKTAARIVLELKNKLAAGITEELAGKSHDREVVEALEALGYQLSEIRDVLKEIDTSLSTEEKIKNVLQKLGM